MQQIRLHILRLYREAPAESTEQLDASLIAAMLLIVCSIAVGMSDAIAGIGLPW
jgi:hypothetical protein